MLMEKASKVNALIVLPEGTEDRILKAARIITKQKIAKIVLLGKEEYMFLETVQLIVFLTQKSFLR